MASNVVGLFDTHAWADNAIRQLIDAGIAPAKISVVTADPGGTIQRQVADRTDSLAATGAATGAASGLIVGSLVGLLIGALTIAAPPAGFLLAGPIAGLLGGAGIGVVSGGLLGVMIGLGLSETDAEVVAESIRRGATVLTIEVLESERATVETILTGAGATSVADRAAQYYREGFVKFDPNAPAYTEAEAMAELVRVGNVPATTLPRQDSVTIVKEKPRSLTEEELVPIGMDTVFRQHYEAAEKGMTGRTFEFYRPAYRFGYEAAELPEFQGKTWIDVQPDLKWKWEEFNRGTWDQFAAAIRFGWNCLAPAEPRGHGTGRVEVL